MSQIIQRDVALELAPIVEDDFAFIGSLSNLKDAGYKDAAADHLYMRGGTTESGVSDYFIPEK